MENPENDAPENLIVEGPNDGIPLAEVVAPTQGIENLIIGRAQLDRHMRNTDTSIWGRIMNDPAACARIKNGSMCMRFDIDAESLKSHRSLKGTSEYIYATGIRENFGEIPAPDADSGDCLTVKFAGDVKTMRVSKSLLSFHSETIAMLLQSDQLEEKDTVTLRDVKRATFKNIMYIIYYAAAYVGNRVCYVRFVRVGQLEALLRAVDMLGLPYVRRSISDGLVKLLPFYDIITGMYINFMDYMQRTASARVFMGDPYLRGNRNADTLTCTCGRLCGGSLCAKIEDDELRELLEGPPGKHAIEDLSTLIHILDRHGMHDVLSACMNHMINTDSFKSLSKPNGTYLLLEDTEDNPFSAKTYSMIIKRLMDIYRDHSSVCDSQVMARPTHRDPYLTHETRGFIE
jgi:hypothetical protein